MEHTNNTAIERRYSPGDSQPRYHRLLRKAKIIYGERPTNTEERLIEDYKRFLKFLAGYREHNDLNHLTEEDYLLFLDMQEAEGASTTTVKNAVRAARYWHDMNENSKTVFPTSVADMLHLPEEGDPLGL